MAATRKRQSRNCCPTTSGIGRSSARRATASTTYKPDARVVELEGENQRLEAEVDRLGLLIPQQGDVVLKGDDAKAWPLFKALGKPEDVKKQLDELPALRTTVSDAQRKGSAAEAAALLKWNPDATSGLVLDKGLVVSLVDGKDKDGKAIKVAHVRPKDDEKAATVPMEDWVKTNAAYLLPALSATGGSSGTSGGSTSTTPTNVIPFPVQGAGGTPAATGDPVADFAAKQAQARARRASEPVQSPAHGRGHNVTAVRSCESRKTMGRRPIAARSWCGHSSERESYASHHQTSELGRVRRRSPLDRSEQRPPDRLGERWRAVSRDAGHGAGRRRRRRGRCGGRRHVGSRRRAVGAIPSGTTLDFGGAKFARLTAPAAVGAVTLTVGRTPDRAGQR
jgi:hypothetical protein